MIQAKELRINNWVNSNLTNNYSQASAADIYNINQDQSVVDPIPLTEEILLNCGFKKFYDIFLYDRFRFDYKKSYKYWYVTDRETNAYLTKIEFLHELQNFYFALTGTELKINI